MTNSESIKNISAALALFHKEMGKIKKTETNPFFKSKYADLPAILDAIKEPLEKAGLVFVQFPENMNDLTTTLIHVESGEYMQGTYNMPPTKNDPQGIGSAITYQRRYALGAILGLNIAEDDDGNAASVKKPVQATTAPRTVKLNPYQSAEKMILECMDQKELDELIAKISSSTKLDEDDKNKLLKLADEHVTKII